MTGLVGERLRERNLACFELAGRCAQDGEASRCAALPQHGHEQRE
jgi:hypothetical protein